MVLLAFMPAALFAQEKWDLKRCVDYALEHNISVKVADVQARTDALQKKAAKALTVPTLSFNTNAGVNFGRSIDPTSNQFTTQQILFQGLGVNSGITLFNWNNIRNQIMAVNTTAEASMIGIERAKNDISLNVAASYLTLLQSIEQVNIAKVQIEQTSVQLANARKLVEAGSKPELDAVQLEAQLATDSSTYVTAISTADQNKISLMALLNLDLSVPFEVSVPDVDKIPLEPLSELHPGTLYKEALVTQPLQKQNELIIKSQEYNIKAARGAMYPTISAFAGLSSNYSSSFSEFVGATPTGKFDTVAVVPINGTNYFALTPGYNVSTKKIGYFKQIADINFAQNIGISVNVPIFQNRQLRTNYERSKLTLENLKLQQEQDNLTLYQNIYSSYNTAVRAIESYNANLKRVRTAEYALNLSEKRYEIGMLTTVEYITNQNNVFTAKINLVSSKYEYVFRMKLLEFFRGAGIKL